MADGPAEAGAGAGAGSLFHNAARRRSDRQRQEERDEALQRQRRHGAEGPPPPAAAFPGGPSVGPGAGAPPYPRPIMFLDAPLKPPPVGPSAVGPPRGSLPAQPPSQPDRPHFTDSYRPPEQGPPPPTGPHPPHWGLAATHGPPMYPPYAGWAAVYEGGHPAQYHGQWWNRRHQGQGQGQGPPQQVPVWPALPYASHAPPPYPYPVEGPVAAWQRTAPPLPISWQSGGDQTRGVAPARWPSTTHMTEQRRPPPESWAGSESPPESRGTDASRGGEGPALPLPLPPVITAKSRDRLVLQQLVVKEGSRVGFAFVQYAAQETADRIKRSNTMHFRGRKLTIGDARRKPTPQPTTPDTTAAPAPAPADSSVATPVPTLAVAPATGPASAGVPAAALDVVANLEAAVQSFVEFVPPAEADPAEVPDAETASAVDAEHQDGQPQPASHHSVPIAEDARVAVVASPPAASAGASTGQAGPEMPWPTATAAPAAPPAGRGKRRRASEAAAPPPWPGPTGPTPAASDGSWAAAAMGPAGGAMDETTLQLAMSWYHTGYWTGYYAAKARRTRPAV